MKKKSSKLARIKPRGAVTEECPSGRSSLASHAQLSPMERWHRLKEHIVKEGESIFDEIDDGPLWEDELSNLLDFVRRPDAFEML